MPDLTIKFDAAVKDAIIEVCRYCTKKDIVDRIIKYRRLNKHKVGWVLVIGFTNDFEKIKKFVMFKPGANPQCFWRKPK